MHVCVELNRGLVREHKKHMETAQKRECDNNAGSDDPAEGDALSRTKIQLAVPGTCHGFQKRLEERDHDKHTTQCQVQEEQAEVSVVGEAYTVVDPRTMVIHFKHASFANAAVVCSGRLLSVALVTPLPSSSCRGVLICSILIAIFHQGLIPLRWQAGICKDRLEVVVNEIHEKENSQHSTRSLHNDGHLVFFCIQGTTQVKYVYVSKLNSERARSIKMGPRILIITSKKSKPFDKTETAILVKRRMRYLDVTFLVFSLSSGLSLLLGVSNGADCSPPAVEVMMAASMTIHTARL